MKTISICYSGTEDICATEIRELCSVDSEQHPSAVIFDVPEKKLLKYCYLSQTPIKILGFLGYVQFQNLTEILDFTKKINISSWINKKTTFKVKCTRFGDHDFTSEEIMKQVGEIFFEKYQLKVNLNHPDLLIYIYIFDNNYYIGIDLTRKDHSKRDYKIFSPAETIKAPIGYSLLRIADYDANEMLLNPITGSGIIAIEAALYASKKSINYYEKERFNFEKLIPFKQIYFEGFFDEFDKDIIREKLKIYACDSMLSHVKYAQKNAKIAGIDKLITITKMDIEWLDTKLDQKSVNKIITFLPSISKRKSETDIRKLYKEFFYQLQYILADQALIVVILQKNELLKEIAQENKFKVIHERQILQGKSKYWVNVLEKE